jgi:hypothetical protein
MPAAGPIDFPTISIWEREGTEWARVGDIAAYEDLVYVPTFRDVGSWSMTREFDDAADLLIKNRLITVDWRGSRSTWKLRVLNPHTDDDTGEPVFTASAVGAYDLFSHYLAWPNPLVEPLNSSAAANNQPVWDPAGLAPYDGPAETVIRELVRQNIQVRRGVDITLPTSQGRGTRVQARPAYENLGELVTKLATDGGIGVDVGLVNTSGSGTRARLTLLIWAPEDKTKDVRLTPAAGSVTSWEQADTAPTATQAMVAGPGQSGANRFVRWPVTTAAAQTAAGEWGDDWEVFVDGPDSFDPAELIQAGRQALAEGAATRTLGITAAEDEGTLAFRDYNVGDRITQGVLPGVEVEDVVAAISVTVNLDAGVTVAPVVGNPEALDEGLDLANQIRLLRRAIRQQERK